MKYEIKKSRKTEQEQLAVVSKLRPIDDGFFEVMMEDPDTCEELLQVFMEKPNLRIKKDTVTGQKSIRIVGKRSIRVDAYAEGTEDVVFNIEIQKANDDNHVKRVRYNASAITVNRSEPGDKFEHVQEVYMIYVSNFDVLKNGKTVSHAEMICQETGESLHDGLHEIYVTTTGRDGSKIDRLMQEFLNPNMNNPEFPRTSRRVQEMKQNPKEVATMCELIEEYANKRAEEIAKEVAKKAAKEAAKKATRETAIRTTIEELREVGVAEEKIANRLKEKYNLRQAQIVAYMR